MLTDKQLKNFRDIYTKRFGVDLTNDEALSKGLDIVRLLELVYWDDLKK